MGMAVLPPSFYRECSERNKGKARQGEFWLILLVNFFHHNCIIRYFVSGVKEVSTPTCQRTLELYDSSLESGDDSDSKTGKRQASHTLRMSFIIYYIFQFACTSDFFFFIFLNVMDRQRFSTENTVQ